MNKLCNLEGYYNANSVLGPHGLSNTVETRIVTDPTCGYAQADTLHSLTRLLW